MASSAPSNKIERAHQMYRNGRFEGALGFYTEALSTAKAKAQKIALHSNRAACYLKLHNFKKGADVTDIVTSNFKAAEECTSVLELDHNHTGALMLRAQTLVTLKEYHSALFDVNRLLDLNPSSEVYLNLQTRLRTQLSLAPIPESEAELEEEEEGKTELEPNRNKEEDKQDEGIAVVGIYKKAELNKNTTNAEIIACKTKAIKELSEQGRDQKSEPKRDIPAGEVVAPRMKSFEESYEQVRGQKSEPKIALPTVEAIAPRAPHIKESSDQQSRGWQAIPKPKGHSTLDYGRWDRVEDDSSEDDDEDEEESQPHYRFRVRTVGVQRVK